MKHFRLFTQVAVTSCIATAAAFMFAFAARPARADEALIIGVNEYPHLENANLAGAINDAKAMEAKLKLYHFDHAVVLTNAQATKKGILDALSDLKTRLQPNDRVVVYFAGHGTRNSKGDAILLPSDAEEASEANDLSAQELYDAVKVLPAEKKTIIVDACHAAGLARSVGDLHRGTVVGKKRLYARFYVRGAGKNARPKAKRDVENKTWRVVTVGDTNPVEGTGVLYYTAAMKTEKANEMEIDGVRRGVFTYVLDQQLDGKADLWEALDPKIRKAVTDKTDSEQTPIFFPGSYLKHSVFDLSAASPDSVTPPTNPPAEPVTSPVVPDPAPIAPAPVVDLGTFFNKSNADTAKMQLEMTPALSPLQVGSQVRLKMTSGAEGYLVLVGRDPSGNYQMLFPRTASINDAKVGANAVTEFPGSGEAIVADTPGADRLKAFLFTTTAGAEEMIQAFAKGELNKESKSWSVVKVDTATVAPFYTAEIVSTIDPKSDAPAK